jgi:hypothetical protein
MNKAFKFIGKVLSVIAVVMLVAFPAHAGKRLPEGTVLAEESYVFTVDEATELMQTIESLEAKVAQQEETIVLHKELDEVNEEQEVELEVLLEIRHEQITAYEEWVVADAARIKALERQKRITQLERWGFLAIGVVVTGGAIIVADRLDDRVLENN